MSDSKVVVASNSDFGIASKMQRGLAGGLGEMPSSLSVMKSSLARFATRLGISLEGSVKDIAISAEKAIRSRGVSKAAVASPSSGHGMAL